MYGGGGGCHMGCSVCTQRSGAGRQQKGHAGCMHALGAEGVTLWAQEGPHGQRGLPGACGGLLQDAPAGLWVCT